MRLFSSAFAAALVALPVAAQADTLAGDTVNVTYAAPTTTAVYSNIGNFVVPGSGTLQNQASPSQTLATFTLSANQITMTASTQQNFVGSTFNGFEFTDLNPNTDITNVTIDGLSSLNGAVTFTGNEIFVNFQGIGNVNPGQTEILDVTAVTVATPPSTVTPEPSSIALLGTGLLGIAGGVRRRFLNA